MYNTHLHHHYHYEVGYMAVAELFILKQLL